MFGALAPLTSTAARALLSPSARVLVAAAHAGGVRLAAELPWHDVHWPTLVSLTSFERAEAQLCRVLHAAPVGAVPDDVLRAMQGIFRVAVFRSHELADAAAAAADALQAAGIDALWLKGAALAMQSPEEFAVRSMGDLDLLVPPDQHGRARDALREAGWNDGVGAASYEGHHHDAPMLFRGGSRLELHSALFPPGNPFAADSAAAWIARGVDVRWADRMVRVLPCNWHIVHASIHWAWSHEGEVGSWQYFHDIHRLSAGWRQSDPRWATVVQNAESIGAASPVGWALWAAARLVDLDVAEPVISRLRSPRAMLSGVAEREWVLRAFHSPAASPSVAWSRFWWRRAMGGLGDAVTAWPWALGRAPARLTSTACAATQTHSGRQQASRWCRHLSRVLNG